MRELESKLKEIILTENVNTKLWSCSVIFLVETSPVFSGYPNLFARHSTVTRRPAIQCLSLAELETAASRTSIQLETMRFEWPAIYKRLQASGFVHGGAVKDVAVNLTEAFGSGALRQAVAVKILLLNLRERMMNEILGMGKLTKGKRAIIKIDGSVAEEGEDPLIDDQPVVGPHIYLILSGFYNPRIFFLMLRIKIPITCIIALGPDPGTIHPKNILSTDETDRNRYNLTHFWAHLNFDKLDLTKALFTKDVAIVVFDPMKETELTPKSTSGSRKGSKRQRAKSHSNFQEALVQVIYDSTNHMRHYMHYVQNSVVLGIPKMPASRIQVEDGTRAPRAYHSLVDLLPTNIVTAEYILYCMVEHIANSLATGSDDELLLQSTTLWNPKLRLNRLNCRPSLIHRKDTATQLFPLAKSELPIDLGTIHASILSRMPYVSLWDRYPTEKSERVKQESHMYKLWRCSESILPFQTFQDHFNLIILSKFYNTVVEPISDAQLETLLKFIFLRSEIVTFEPNQFSTDKLQEESIKLRDFVQCLEILTAFDFPPVVNEPTSSYNAFDELESLVCLQCLQKAFRDYNDMFYVYYPPTDRMLFWFHNDITSDELNSYTKKGVLRVPVGFGDFLKYTKNEERRWLSDEQKAIEQLDAKAREAFTKEIEDLRVKNDKETGQQEMRNYQIPLNFVQQEELDVSEPQRVLYNVQPLQIENKEQVTEFVTAEGATIKSKIHEWAYGSDRVLSLVMNSDGTTVSHHRIIEDRQKNKGADDGNIVLSMISPEQAVYVSYAVKTTFSTTANGENQQDSGEKSKEGEIAEEPKSVKKKSISGGAGGGKRMSVKKKSIAGGGGKRMSVKKKSIAGGGGKRMSVKKKSIAGGGGKRMSVKKKSIAGGGGKRMSVKKKSIGGKRQSMKRRLTKSPGAGRRGSSKIKSSGHGDPKIIETSEHEIRVITGSGLLVTFPVIDDVRVVKQEFLPDVTTQGTQLKERYRLFLPDGGILVYKDDGHILLLHPNSTITRITQIDRLVSTSGVQDRGVLRRTTAKSGTPGRKSLKKKSIVSGGGKRMSVKKKSIAGGGGKRMSVKKKSIAGGGGKRMSVKKKSIAGGGGKRMSVKKKSIAGGGGKRMSVKKKSIAAGGKRMSVKKKSIAPGGKRPSTRKSLDGRRKVSSTLPVEVVSFEIGKHEVVDHYGTRTFYEKNTPQSSDEPFKIRVGQEPSGRIYVKRTDGCNSYYKDDGTLHVKHQDGTLITSEPLDDELVLEDDNDLKGEGHEEANDSAGHITWKLKYTHEHPKYARVEWTNSTPTVTLPDNTTVTTGETTPFSVKMNGVTANFNQNEATLLTYDPTRSLDKTSSSKFFFPLLRHHENGPALILESVDSWGRSFRVLSDGTIDYSWPDRLPVLQSNGPVYDVSRFNKFFIVDRSMSGFELIQSAENSENQLLICPKTSPYYGEQGEKPYSFQDIRPSQMAKKELTRYLVFPQQQRLFNLPKVTNDCPESPCQPVEFVPRAQPPPPPVILHETSHLIPRYNIAGRFQNAVHRYVTFHEILFKKYLTYLSELDRAVKITPPFVLSVDPAEGVVGKYLAVENDGEKEKLLRDDGCFNKGDTIRRTYLKPVVLRKEILTNIVNF